MNIYLTASSVFFSKNQDQPNSLIGQDSPDFSLVSDTENEISLKQFLGERVELFWVFYQVLQEMMRNLKTI